MTSDEAQAEAVRRWGLNAVARIHPSQGYPEVGVDIHEAIGWNVKKWGPIITIYGYGSTWEEAFTNADAGQYRKLKEHEHNQNTGTAHRRKCPPERAPETDKAPSQMRLFP